MPRTTRAASGGMVFHVLYRGVGRMRLFLKDADFDAFERNIEKTLETYCLMSNHIGISSCGQKEAVPRAR